MKVTSSRSSTPGPRAAEPVGVPGPILIGGLSHTGKTELRIALDAHPHVTMTRGTGMWTKHYARYGDLSRRRNVRRCVAALAHDRAVMSLGTDIERLRRDLGRGLATYARLFALVHEQHAEREGVPRWGDQLRGVERHADQIFAGWPDARMIHMVRDPRRRLAGMPRLRASAGKLGWEAGRWVAAIELAAHHALRHRDRYLVVRYEDLLEQPGSVMRHVSRFVGVDHDDAMLRALLATSALIDHAASPVGGRPHDPFVRAFLEGSCADELRALRYEVAAPRPDSPRSGARHLVNRAAMRVHRTRTGRRSAGDLGSSRARALSEALDDPLRQAPVVEGET